MPLFEVALSGCTKITADMADVGKKFELLKNRPDWQQLSMKIYEDNKAYIDAKTQAVITDWSTGAYFNSGMDTGNIEEVFLKNAPQEVEPELQPFMFLVPF